MKHVRDTTGRLALRPHYEVEELDDLCEQVIVDFISYLHGKFILPVPTDDLEKLIERDATDLDLYADLSAEGADVEGVTYFIPNEKPRVCISSFLSESPYREHRLRTTLTHEYGHVKFHAPLWNTPVQQLSLFAQECAEVPQKCHRAGIFANLSLDWMEWQAGYVCGALLMPRSFIREQAQAFYARYRLPGQIQSGTYEGMALQQQIATLCDVSQDAARVRLIKLGYLVESNPGAPLIL